MFIEYILKNKGSDVVAVDPDMTAEDVAKVFSDQKIGYAIVRDEDGGIIGTVTERDLVQSLAKNGEKSVSALVKDFMTTNIVICNPADTLPKVMGLMTVRRSRHVLVMDNGNVIGLVSIGDVVKFRLEESMLDEESLREYVSGMGYN